jgi:hypothetical protein
MSDSDSKAILEQLKARRGNSPEFILELEGYTDDLAHGELDGADKKYIRDLAKRLGKPAGGDVEIIDPAEEVIDVEEADSSEQEAWEDTRFARAKAAFHERFNPENLDPEAADTALRREIYEQYWAELERIEDEG